MTDAHGRAWLAPGSRVAIRSQSGWSPASWSVATVERHTATQIVTDNGRFRLDNLRQVGGDGELRRVTDEEYRRFQAHKLLGSLRYDIDRNILGQVPLRASATDIFAAFDKAEKRLVEAKARLAKLVVIFSEPEGSTVQAEDDRPSHLWPCGCLINDGDAHRVGCPEYPQGRRGER